jgi:hypothetical protein
MKPRRWASALAVLALASTAGCHFYFSDEGDDDDDDVTFPDADPRPFPDADPNRPDADPVTPDAGACETVNDFLARFGGCMSLTDWQSLGMCDVPLQTTMPGDTCASCHTDGTGMTFMSADCEDTFNANRFMPYILGLVQPVENGEGCFVAFQGGKWLATPPAGHPPFTFSDTNKTAIDNFFQFTFTRYADDTFSCPPPKAP